MKPLSQRNLQHALGFPFPSFLHRIESLPFERYAFVLAKCLELIFHSLGWHTFCSQIFLQIRPVLESFYILPHWAIPPVQFSPLGCQPASRQCRRASLETKCSLWIDLACTTVISCRKGLRYLFDSIFLSHLWLLASLFLSNTGGAEISQTLSIIATTVVKEKDIVMFRMEKPRWRHRPQSSHSNPTTLCIDTLLDFNNKRCASKCLFLWCASLLSCC